MIDATVKESGACVTATRDRMKTGKLSSPSGSPVPGRQHVESHAPPCKSLFQCPMVHRACLFPPRQHRTGDILPSTWLDVSAGVSKREACSQRNRSREKVIIALVALQTTRKLQKQHSCRRDIHRGRTRTSSWQQWLTPTRCPVWCEACAFPLAIGRVRPYSRDTTPTRRVRRPREGACGQDTIAVSSWSSTTFPTVVGAQKLLFSFLLSMFISALNAPHGTGVSPNTSYPFPSHFSPVAHVQHLTCNPLFALVLSDWHRLRGIREVLPSVAVFALSQSNQASLARCIDTLSTPPAIKNERAFTEIAVKEAEGLEIFELWG